MSKLREPVIFRIRQEEIGAFLALDTNLLPNGGSAFYKAVPADKVSMDIKAAYGDLLTDKEFQRALRIITQPDLYAIVRAASVQGLSEIRLHRKRSEGEYVAAVEETADGILSIAVYDDYKSWLAGWIDEFTVQTDQPAANYIPPKVSLEEFLFVLHAIDTFRRVSYQNMLDHVFVDRAYVKVTEFLHSMANSLKSLDIRWLLPAFLAVTPGVEQYRTEIDPQNIGVLLVHDFLREGKLGSGEDVLVFGEAGQIMGVEFFRSWFTSFGAEINVAGADGFQAVERFFIAPTLLGSHFVRLEDAGNGKALVNHQLYTTEQLTFKLEELFGKAFAMGQANSASSTSPASKFCSSCGSQIPTGAAFCGNCGTKVK